MTWGSHSRNFFLGYSATHVKRSFGDCMISNAIKSCIQASALTSARYATAPFRGSMP